ncbi:hypothetical protein M422DRAFT_250030 [Sphaerobolus stellatus SS14]|nr:hypothetical protein M422DRAFT_250030 [Sphaerobolus stellatus SS14]
MPHHVCFRLNPESSPTTLSPTAHPILLPPSFPIPILSLPPVLLPPVMLTATDVPVSVVSGCHVDYHRCSVPVILSHLTIPGFTLTIPDRPPPDPLAAFIPNPNLFAPACSISGCHVDHHRCSCFRCFRLSC